VNVSRELKSDEFKKWSAADRLYAHQRQEWPADQPTPTADELDEWKRQAAADEGYDTTLDDLTEGLGVYTGNAVGSTEVYAGKSAVDYDNTAEEQLRLLAVTRGLDYRGDTDALVDRLKRHDAAQQSRAQQASQFRPNEQTSVPGETDYNALDTQQLKELARARNLDDKGKKAELVERLELDDQVNAPSTAQS